jgi:hypothetical protein
LKTPRKTETEVEDPALLLVVLVVAAAAGSLAALASGLARLLAAGLERAGRGLAALGGDIALFVGGGG